MSDRKTCSSAKCPNLAHRSCRGMCKKHYHSWLRQNPPVDAAIVQAHIEQLRAAGFGYRRISEISGAGWQTIRDISAGHRRYTYSDVAAAILSVNVDSDLPAKINPVGVTRRIRALIALGYTETQIGKHVSIRQCNLWKYIQGTASWTRPATFARVDCAFRELEGLPQPQGPVAERARRRAASRGWLPPLAWDAETIDDPDAEPSAWAIRQKRTVAQYFAEEYFELRDHAGLTDSAIAARMNITQDTLISRLSRAKIPAQLSPVAANRRRAS